MHTETEEDVNDVIPSNFPKHLNTAQIYHKYRHVISNLYRPKAKLQTQVVVKHKRWFPQTTTKSISNNAGKLAKATKQPRKVVTTANIQIEITKMATTQSTL